MWLRRAGDALFYGYVGTTILAGAWGAVFGRVDQGMLLELDLASLPRRTQANVMTQYGFLRAIELGFGLFALSSREAIHQNRACNQWFLGTMGAGVAARLASLRLDGSPGPPMYVFAAVELVGVPVIYAYTRTTLDR